METVSEDSEWTCGVCFEKCIYKSLGQHSCFLAIPGMQAILIYHHGKTVYPSSVDGKLVVILDRSNNSLTTIMWSGLSKLLQKPGTGAIRVVQQQPAKLLQTVGLCENEIVQQQPEEIFHTENSGVNKIVQQQTKVLQTAGLGANKIVQQQQTKVLQTAGLDANKIVQQQQTKSSCTAGLGANQIVQQQQQSKVLHTADFGANKIVQQSKVLHTAGLGVNKIVQQQPQTKVLQTAGLGANQIVQQQQQQSKVLHTADFGANKIVQQKKVLHTAGLSANKIVQQQQTKVLQTAGLDANKIVQQQQTKSSCTAGLGANQIVQQKKVLHTAGLSVNKIVQQQQTKVLHTAGLGATKKIQQQKKISQTAGLGANKIVQQQQTKVSHTAGLGANKKIQQQKKILQTAGFGATKNIQQQKKVSQTAGTHLNSTIAAKAKQKESSNLRELLTPSPTMDYESEMFINDENNPYDHQLDNPSADECFAPSSQDISTHPPDPNELLIMSVESRPPLWDYRLDPALRSYRAKQKLWEEISNIPGISGTMNIDQIKAKWKSLRDNYRSIILKEEYDIKKSGSAALAKKPKWIYYDIMSFAQDRCLVTDTISNCPGQPRINNDSDEDSREVTRKDAHKGRRSRNKNDVDESAVTALMLIAEKLSSSEVQLPPMPVQDDVDFALAVVADNCRQVSVDERRDFLKKFVNESFEIPKNKNNKP